MEEDGEGIRRSQECVVLVMVEMISAGWILQGVLLLLTLFTVEAFAVKDSTG